MYLGDTLGGIVDALVNDRAYEPSAASHMDLGVDVLPQFMKDNSDRNRTSPFAFTGNKFEFRMPGSAMNFRMPTWCSTPQWPRRSRSFADAVEGAEDFEAVAKSQLVKTLKPISASSSTATAMPRNGPSRPRSAVCST